MLTIDCIQEVKEYYQMILNQKSRYYEIIEADNKVELKGEKAIGEVRFHEMNILELEITDIARKEIVFYLHFQYNEKEHAQRLFREMKDALVKMKDRRTLNVLLSCSSGLTTSFFADQLNSAAELLKLDYHFSAVSYNELYEYGMQNDVILLAPQIGFQMKKVQAGLKGKLVLTIPAQIFASYDSGSMISMIQKEMEKAKPKQTKAQWMEEKLTNDARVLAIGIVNGAQKIRLIYRYYDQGNIEDYGTILKPNISIRDIEDIIDTQIARHPEIERIGISMPGTEVGGKVTYGDTFNHEDISLNLIQKYKRWVTIENDCNSVATGLYALQDHFDNLVFYFQPYGSPFGGSGVIVNGQLVRGKNHYAGEVSAVQKAFNLDHSPQEVMWTNDGVLELVSKTLAAEICTVAPEAVFIHSRLSADMNVLREELKKYLPEESIPELRYMDNFSEYMMAGIMLKCLSEIDVYDVKECYGNRI